MKEDELSFLEPYEKLMTNFRPSYISLPQENKEIYQ